ncbi:hypothetical protein [Ruminococcus sp.]|uniref:hypothetical protein n=1 Tax=Ruminococcus sp. TaxID=41978 RepID=UPI00386F7A49
MANLKKYWLKTAKSFVLAPDDLIVAVAETAKAGRDMVIEWAESENFNVEAEGTEIPTEEAAEAPAEEVAAEETPAEKPAEEPAAEPEVKAEAKAEPEAPAEEKPKKSKK